MQVILVNESVTVLVNHVECLLEFLDLRLVEHSEHVRRGSLSPLLRGLCFCFSARHLELCCLHLSETLS